jgi:hypothetical protein
MTFPRIAVQPHMTSVAALTSPRLRGEIDFERSEEIG